MTPNILVIDDDPSILELLRYNLSAARFHVITASTGREALAAVERPDIDLVILDLMLPDLSGFDICREFRQHSRAPVMVLTARYNEADRIRALDAGADDYLTKPFSPRELLARLRAHLRRWSWRDQPDQNVTEATVGPLYMNSLNRVVLFKGEPLHLTPMEFDILWILARTPGRVYPRERLLALATGQTVAGTARTVDVHIRALRLKLEDDPAIPRFLETVRGAGYCLGRTYLESQRSVRQTL